MAMVYLYARAMPWLVAALFLWLVYYARSSKTNLELRHSQRETVRALASIVDSSTPFLGGESEKVAALAVEMGKKLGLAGRHLRALEYAALLHDIGYLAVGNRILSKGESLSPEEWASVRRHAETGASILGKVQGLNHASALVLAHHERPDGRGYPRRLPQASIPVGASILKVADAFVAMTAERPYRPAMSAAQAVERIASKAGTKFDREVVTVLVELHRSSALGDLEEREAAKAA
jgi:HD-GYP domain-containing protein (c-di-GMP phosphodiesterase class II)